MPHHKSAFRRPGWLASAAICAAVVSGPAIALQPAVADTAPTRPDVVDLGITDVLALLESGTATSAGLVEEYLARIQAYDNPYGDQPGLAAVVVANEDALETAKQLDAERAAGNLRGPLHGVPILVKDNYATFDMPTSAGNASLAGYQTAADSTAVARLRDAGAIIIAKANMSEFAWSGEHSLSSVRGRVANPYNQLMSASGSSGGTGAGVAASYAPAGLGTDSCGSILGPSVHASLVGYRPTMGLTSVNGIVPLSLRQDVSGPMTKSVADAALLLEVLAGYDPADPQTEIAIGQSTDQYVESLSDTALEGKRIGYFHWDWAATTDYEAAGHPGLDETIGLVDAAVADLQEQGATIVDVPFTREFFDDVLVSGGWMDTRANIDAFLAETEATWPEGLAAVAAPTDALTFADIVADGRISATLSPEDLEYILAQADIPNAEYDAAGVAHQAGRDAIDAFFEEHDIDALALPTTEIPAAPDIADNPTCGLGANMGIPTMTIPAGFTASGLPVGLELAGPRNTDAQLLAMGYDYEQATQHRVAPASTPELPRIAEPPVEEPPVVEPPVVEPPVEEPPVDEPATEQPVDEPAMEQPVVNAPAELPSEGGGTGATADGDDVLAHTGSTGVAAQLLAGVGLLIAGTGAIAVRSVRRRRALSDAPGR